MGHGIGHLSGFIIFSMTTKWFCLILFSLSEGEGDAAAAGDEVPVAAAAAAPAEGEEQKAGEEKADAQKAEGEKPAEEAAKEEKKPTKGDLESPEPGKVSKPQCLNQYYLGTDGIFTNLLLNQQIHTKSMHCIIPLK